MKLSEVKYPDGLPVDGYGPGFFRVAGQVHTGAMVVFDGQVEAWNGYEDTDWITRARGKIDVVLLGTGAEIRFPDKVFQGEVERAGLAIEPMVTASACRTYNVLLSEGRRVALAVFPV